jgi:hypothetical protein
MNKKLTIKQALNFITEHPTDTSLYKALSKYDSNEILSVADDLESIGYTDESARLKKVEQLRADMKDQEKNEQPSSNSSVEDESEASLERKRLRKAIKFLTEILYWEGLEDYTYNSINHWLEYVEEAFIVHSIERTPIKRTILVSNPRSIYPDRVSVTRVHYIVTLEYKDKIFSFCYNTASNTLAYTANDSVLRFYTIPKEVIRGYSSYRRDRYTQYEIARIINNILIKN